MGKTLGKILEFGSLAALGVFTAGVGLGVAVGGLTLSSAVAVSAGAFGGALGIGASAFTTLALAGVSSLISILGPSAPRPTSSETSQKTPTPERVRAYGHCGLFGAGCGLYATASDSGVAGDVWFFHDNPWAPIGGIDGFYLGDDRVANTRGVLSGLKDGTYGDGKVEIDYRLGARVETAYSQLVSIFGGIWTTSHRGDGVTTGMVTWQPVKSADYNKRYGKGQPPLRAIGRWSTVYDWRDTGQSLTDPLTWKWSENAVLHDVHYRLITEGKQPVLPMTILDTDGTTVIANPAWVSELAAILQEKWDALFARTLSTWTAAANDADDQMPITRYSVLLSADDSPDGDHTILIPNAQGLTIGMTITISALDNINHSETRNVASISAAGAGGYTIGLDSEVTYSHPQGSEVSWESTDTAPLYEPRYRSCVAYKLTDAYKVTKAAISACYDGWVAPREDGSLVCYSGRYYAPTMTIGPDQIVGHSFEDGVDDEDAVNTLTITYISANHNYFAVECTPWTDDDDIAARGRIATQPLQNQVPSYTQARRLAKRALARAMAPYRGSVTTNADGRMIAGQRYIHLTIEEGGATWYDGPAEITALTYNLLTGGVTFQWIAADPNIDDWSPATEEGLPAPVGNRVAAQPLAAPVITAATPNFGSDSATGSQGVFIDLTVEGLNRDDVIWFVRTRQTGAAVWGTRTYDSLPAGVSVDIASEFVPADASVDVEAAYQTGDGRVSPWSATTVVNTSSASIPPARVSGLKVTPGTAQATVEWDNPNSGNLAAERLYSGTTSSFGSATQVGSDLTPANAGVHMTKVVSETTGTTVYFWVTTVSTGGAESTPVGPVSATIL